MKISHSPSLILAMTVAAAILLAGRAAYCLEYDLRGQASLLANGRSLDDEGYYIGEARYLPQVTLTGGIGKNNLIDLEASLDAFARAGSEDGADTSAVDLYRLKLRFATPRSETRIGLQQLNFGPAYLLRPLRWFDRLDPRDPLGLTDGVYALSFRYVAATNASIWLWGLYGNDEPKGYEMLATPDDEVEFGGRMQVPVSSGEVALTFHRRTVTAPGPYAEDFPEYRYALDGRWDIEIGLWLEAVLTHQKSEFLPFEWRQMVTLGGDYTLPLGNGPHVLMEHMAVDAAARPLEWDEDSHVSGLMVGYPLGLMDRLTAIGFYSWEDKEYSQFLGWQRAWDRFTLEVSVFHYPDGGGSVYPGGAGVLGGGSGGQLVFIFNH